MLIQQLLQSVWFYLIFSLSAGLGLLFTSKIFSKNSLLGYFAAKPLGLVIFGYAVWLLASLKILNYQNNSFIILVFFLSVMLGFGYFFQDFLKTSTKSELKQFLKNLLILEVLSLVLYLGYLYLRSYNPAAYGTERFMDMMLVNSSLKAQSFPFIDAWYAGKAVNYYYYGHYLVSLLTKLSGLNSFLTYNFAIGLLYTVSFILPGLLVYQIVKNKGFAVLSGFLVTTAGSLFYSGCAINSWINAQAACSYASSTRLYTPSYIINEIPSYSFTVGDLHAHFLALPFFILNLVLIYALVKSERINQYLNWALLFSVVTSALINPTDATTLAVLLTMIWLYKVYGFYKAAGNFSTLYSQAQFQDWFNLAVLLIFGGLAGYAPFFLNFKSPVLGMGLAPYFALKHNLFSFQNQYPTPLLALFGMWGVFVFTITALLGYFKKSWKEHPFLIFSFLTAAFLIIFVELFYVKDIYHIANPPYFRANTVFKYGYHTWTLLCITFSALLGLFFQKLRDGKLYAGIISSLRVLVGLFIALSLFYPYQAIVQYYISEKPTKLTLDASQFMATQSQGDLDSVLWMNKNLKGRPVVLEAVGDSYTYFGRMSVFTGNISPMGWQTHEWTWRFDGSKAEAIKEKDPNASVETGYGAVSTVAADVRQIYQSPSLELTVILLKKYGINYVYVGAQERVTYSQLDETKFEKLGSLIYHSGQSKLYKIN